VQQAPVLEWLSAPLALFLELLSAPLSALQMLPA
jgi:hypothetical protein